MTAVARGNGAAIDILNIHKTYGAFKAVDDVNLHIEAGEFMTFLGPSGSGKTTTLNLIAGFTDLSSGEIRISDRPVGHLPAHKRNIGVVFQHYALFPHMTVLKNVIYPLALRGVARREREKIARSVLEMVKLESFMSRYPSELSGGQQQRVALARAIVFNPPLLLMDEPLGALDRKLREWLQMEIKHIHRELGTTFVYVTHDQEEALVLSDRIAVFNHGKIEQVGSGRDLYEHPSTLFVGKFIGESSVITGRPKIDNGTTCLETAGGIARAVGHVDGDKVAILIRPEKIRVSRTGFDALSSQNVLSGTITESVYMGANVKYEITLPDNVVISSRMPLTGDRFNIGDPVLVSWTLEDATLLADDTDLNAMNT